MITLYSAAVVTAKLPGLYRRDDVQIICSPQVGTLYITADIKENLKYLFQTQEVTTLLYMFYLSNKLIDVAGD